MAKPERLPGGFELANGRAADRVSEKEAEAGRSRRGSRTASAAASPWHGPGLRLQRLHKETFLGAAVSLLVRRRRRAGPRALRDAPRPPSGRVPTGSMVPNGLASPRRPPPPTPRGRPRLRPPGALSPALVRMWPPPPPPGAGLLLLPLTGGPAASLLTWPPAGLCSLLRRPPAGLHPSLYGQKLVPSCPLVGGRPPLRGRRQAPRPLPAGGRRPGRLSLPAGSAVPRRPPPGLPTPREWDHLSRGPHRGFRPAPCTT